MAIFVLVVSSNGMSSGNANKFECASLHRPSLSEQTRNTSEMAEQTRNTSEMDQKWTRSTAVPQIWAISYRSLIAP